MRIKMSLKPLVAAAVSAGALMAASSAMAAAPTGDFVNFKYCPYQNTSLAGCIYTSTTSGSFRLGNATVPITAPIIVQGGAVVDPATQIATITGAGNGGQVMPPTRLKVPGGLIGLVSTGGWSGLLIDLFNAAVSAGNDVYATAEVAGQPRVDAFAALSGAAPAVTLPIKVHLENPFLGPNCYIGSNSNPITLRLTTGTTSPPAGTAPITGRLGTLSSNSTGTLLTVADSTLVDNTFAVPAATDCGYLLLDKLLITAGVNLREGFPAAAGRSSASLVSTLQEADLASVAASVH